jgi:two-component system response regulator PilR (NtrC family)
LRLSKEALELLLSFDWPGNIRQLEQAISATAAICDGSEIKPDDFPAWFNHAQKFKKQIQIKTPARYLSNDEPPASLVHAIFSNEDRMRYQEALESTKYPGTGRWNVSAAARYLGIPRKTFAYRLKKLGFIR